MKIIVAESIQLKKFDFDFSRIRRSRAEQRRQRGSGQSRIRNKENRKNIIRQGKCKWGILICSTVCKRGIWIFSTVCFLVSLFHPPLSAAPYQPRYSQCIGRVPLVFGGHWRWKINCKHRTVKFLFFRLWFSCQVFHFPCLFKHFYFCGAWWNNCFLSLLCSRVRFLRFFLRKLFGSRQRNVQLFCNCNQFAIYLVRHNWWVPYKSKANRKSHYLHAVSTHKKEYQK